MAAREPRYESLNPATGKLVESHAFATVREIESTLRMAAIGAANQRAASVKERCAMLLRLAAEMEARAPALAILMAEEIGKPLREGEAEARKCATSCRYYAEHAPAALKPSPRASDATESYVLREPVGAVLAVMPWNFPFWQIFRFAASALVAGNAIVVKPAPNAVRCAMALREVFAAAGLPEGVAQVVLASKKGVASMIADSRIHAVTVTGSTRAGRAIAALAGESLKKCVLELGGSDPFIVFADADLAEAAIVGGASRLINCGQSCIAAKRFIVHESVAREFTRLLAAEMKSRVLGDPRDAKTDLGPLARADLRDALARQVDRSVAMGARVVLGGKVPRRRGFFYPATLLTDLPKNAPVLREETFGPVAALTTFTDADDAIAQANDTPYGLGASIWTRDVDLARSLAPRIAAGNLFVNGLVKSDPRLPFGGVKESGYGRELALEGLFEFTVAKSVWRK